MGTTAGNERHLQYRRELAAPPAIVFQAWTDPEHLDWFLSGNETVATPIEVDLRVGGAWRLMMVINENLEYWTGGIYREIGPVSRLVFTWGAVDGWPEIDPANVDDCPLVELTFIDLGGRTEMVMDVTLGDHLSEEAVQEWLTSGMREGWGMTIDRLVERYAPAS